MTTRTPLPYGQPVFRQASSGPPRTLVSERQTPSSNRPALMMLLAGLTLGFGLSWLLFNLTLGSGLPPFPFNARADTEASGPFNARVGTEASGPPLYDEAVVKAIFDRAAPGVVEVRTVLQVNRRIGEGSGSGFFVDDRGHIVTNSHVVDDASDITVRLHDGRWLSAIKLGNSPHDDLAVLRVDPDEVRGIQPLTLADSDRVSPGQMAIAIGTPFDNFNSVTVGVVSGVGRSNSFAFDTGRPITGLIQTDALLNPGSSGGPLLNSAGEVIGVNSAIRIQSGLQIGVGFAVSSNTVSQILEKLKEPGEFRRPWMGFRGMDLEDLPPDEVDGLGTDTGIYVTNVCEGGPAQSAGIRDDYLSMWGYGRISGRGDIIVGVDEEQVDVMVDLISYINTLEVGDTIQLSLVRNGERTDVAITLDEWEERCG